MSSTNTSEPFSNLKSETSDTPLYPTLPQTKHTVLVLGATGKLGQLVVQKLLNLYNVKALVRNVEKAKKLFGDDVSKIEFIEGDLVKEDGIPTSAVTNVKFIVFAAGKNTLGPFTSNNVDYIGVKNLLQKLKSTNQAKNIEKFILISSFGVTRPWFPVTIILNAIVGMIMKWKLYGENELRESGIPYLIIRPPGLTNKLGGKQIELANGDEMVGSQISREDVAIICQKSISQVSSLPKYATISVAEGPGIATLWDRWFLFIKEEKAEKVPDVDHAKPLYVLGAVSVVVAGLLMRYFRKRRFGFF